MNTLSKTKMAMLILLTGLAFACKKKEDTSVETTYETDTTETVVDTIGSANIDTTAIDQNAQDSQNSPNSKNGTTGSGTDSLPKGQ